MESSAGLHVEIEGSRAFVHLPGKYRLVRNASLHLHSYLLAIITNKSTVARKQPQHHLSHCLPGCASGGHRRRHCHHVEVCEEPAVPEGEATLPSTLHQSSLGTALLSWHSFALQIVKSHSTPIMCGGVTGGVQGVGTECPGPKRGAPKAQASADAVASFVTCSVRRCVLPENHPQWPAQLFHG